MKKYFLHNGKEQEGPFSLEDLKQKAIHSKTMVWFEGIAAWTEAQFIPELKEVAANNPPPFEKPNTIKQTLDKTKKVLDKDYVNEIEEHIPNKKGKRIFKTAIIVLAVLGLAFLIKTVLPTGNKWKTKSDLTGEWISEDKYGSKKTTIFKEDGTFIYIKNNKVVEDFNNIKGKTFKYKVDKSHTPFWIDIIGIDKNTNEEILTMRGIYEYLSENTIRICFNRNSLEEALSRPAEFDTYNTGILTKK